MRLPAGEPVQALMVRWTRTKPWTDSSVAPAEVGGGAAELGCVERLKPLTIDPELCRRPLPSASLLFEGGESIVDAVSRMTSGDAYLVFELVKSQEVLVYYDIQVCSRQRGVDLMTPVMVAGEHRLSAPAVNTQVISYG